MGIMMTPSFRCRFQSGFTLVEVLVGMAVALIGMVMMFQAMQVWDARKRTTAGGSDAQVAGSIAMFSLERDLKMAGYGFGNATAMNCTVAAYDSRRSAPGTFSFPMVPVLIGDGPAGAPDSLTVLYGSGTTMSSSQSFNNLTPPPALANDSFKRTNTRTGLRPGDLILQIGRERVDDRTALRRAIPKILGQDGVVVVVQRGRQYGSVMLELW